MNGFNDIKNNKRETFARIGIATKGIVYCLIGILTALTAINAGGKKLGSRGIIDYLSDQTFGIVLLSLTAIGLAGFVFWRLYQAIEDTQEHGNDIKGLLKRIALMGSALFYLYLLYKALDTIFGFTDGQKSSKNTFILSDLDSGTQTIVLGIIAIVFLGKAVYQLFLAYSSDYTDEIRKKGMGGAAERFIAIAGRIGLTARCIVILAVSYLTFKGIQSGNTSNVEGKEEAFNFLHDQFGTYVLMLIAIGLISYGLFIIVFAKYRQINIT